MWRLMHRPEPHGRAGGAYRIPEDLFGDTFYDSTTPACSSTEHGVPACVFILDLEGKHLAPGWFKKDPNRP